MQNGLRIMLVEEDSYPFAMGVALFCSLVEEVLGGRMFLDEEVEPKCLF